MTAASGGTDHVSKQRRPRLVTERLVLRRWER